MSTKTMTKFKSGILDKFTEIRNDPYAWVAKWKEENKDKKVIAVGIYHFPEEIVHASGALCFGLQEGLDPIVDAYQYIYPSYCGYSRSIVEMGARGILRIFDDVIITDICIQLVKAQHIIHRNFPWPRSVLISPGLDLTKARNKSDVTEDWGRIRTRVESKVGHKITDDDIRHSIEVYNKNRSLLRKIHDMRRKNPGLIRARNMQAIVVAAMVMPKEENNELLTQLIAELEKANPPEREGVPVFLCGHLCHAPKIEVLDMIEEMGGIVVDDDLHTGYRYYAKDARADGDPIEALVDRYKQIDPPCPSRMHPDNNWDLWLLKRAQDAKVKGVIILQPKFCEHQNYAYIWQKKTLSEAGMDHILVETEHEMISLEQIRTKMQAFTEMITAKAMKAKGGK